MTTKEEAERLAAQIETHAGAHWLARDASIMIRKQAAEIERLKAAWTGSLNLAENIREERDKANTLLRQALDAVEANHKHHQDYDDYGGYPESEIAEQNSSTIAAIKTHLGEQT